MVHDAPDSRQGSGGRTPRLPSARVRVAPALELGRRAVHGFALTIAQNAASRVVSLGSQLILAAILSPADFGLVGLTFSFSSLASALINVGVEDVAMQRGKALRLWLGAVFWISLGMSVAAGLILMAAAPILGHLYGSPSLMHLVAILGLTMPVGALSTAPGLILRSRMRFGFLSISATIELVAQVVMTVMLAWAGFGAFSFILPLPITAAARVVIWWRKLDLRIDLRARSGRWRFLVKNTAASTVTRLLIALIAQGDYIVLGLVASKETVGAYYFAFRLAVQPLWVIAGNFIGVLFPALAQLQQGSARERSAVINAVRLLAYAVMPLGFLQAAMAKPAMDVLFSSKWAASVPIIQVLSIGLALDSLSWVAETFLRARGDFTWILRAFALQTPIFFALVLFGSLLGEGAGTAVAVTTYYALTQPFFVYGAFRRLGVTKADVALLYLKPITLSLCAVGTAVAVSTVLSQVSIIRLAIMAPLALAAYSFLLVRFAREEWTQLVSRVRRAF